jgi:hypothetical protein
LSPALSLSRTHALTASLSSSCPSLQRLNAVAPRSGQAANLSAETHTFTLPQALAIALSLLGSLGVYYLCNRAPRAQKLVDLHSFSATAADPVFLLLLPLALVASLAPVHAVRLLLSQPDAARAVAAAGDALDGAADGGGGGGGGGSMRDLLLAPLVAKPPAKEPGARC